MDLLKLLIESLVFSHVLYCLPVLGPSLSDVNVNRLKRLQHRAICLCVYICSIFNLIIHQWFRLVFGQQHQYATQTTQLFAQPPGYRLAFSQRFFRSQVVHWWNVVSNDILTSSTFQDDLFFFNLLSKLMQ